MTAGAGASTTGKEEYLQAVWTLSDEGEPVIAARLAEFLRVSPASVSEMVHRLERDQLVRLSERNHILLTPMGDALARQVVRRHRLIERMLTDLLGYEWWKTHDEAERIEHAMSAEMEEHIAVALGHPTTCPHGNPMPGVTPPPTRRLEEHTAGASATVERIPDQFEHEPGFLEYLDGVGVKPGVSVRLVAISADAIGVQIDGRERSVRRDVGRKVLVRA